MNLRNDVRRMEKIYINLYQSFAMSPPTLINREIVFERAHTESGEMLDNIRFWHDDREVLLSFCYPEVVKTDVLYVFAQKVNANKSWSCNLTNGKVSYKHKDSLLIVALPHETFHISTGDDLENIQTLLRLLEFNRYIEKKAKLIFRKKHSQYYTKTGSGYVFTDEDEYKKKHYEYQCKRARKMSYEKYIDLCCSDYTSPEAIRAWDKLIDRLDKIAEQLREMIARYLKVMNFTNIKKIGVPEIKKRYRQLALKLHPDRNRSPNATREFQELNDAYTWMINIKQKKT